MSIYKRSKTWTAHEKWTDSAGDSWNIGVDTKIIEGCVVNAIALWQEGHEYPLIRWVVRDIPLNDLVKDVIAIEETNLKQYMNQRDWETIEPHHDKVHSEDELKQVAKFYMTDYESQLPVQGTVAESIFHRLLAKYPKWLELKIVDVRIIQAQERVWLEITTERLYNGDQLDQTIKRCDLVYFIDFETYDQDFSPDDSVSDNATKFVETFSPYTISMCTKLFHHEARVQIYWDKDLNPHYSPTQKQKLPKTLPDRIAVS